MFKANFFYFYFIYLFYFYFFIFIFFIYLFFIFLFFILFYFFFFCSGKAIELAHDKTNKMACAPREDSDRPVRMPSRIRVFAVHSMGT